MAYSNNGPQQGNPRSQAAPQAGQFRRGPNGTQPPRGPEVRRPVKTGGGKERKKKSDLDLV